MRSGRTRAAMAVLVFSASLAWAGPAAGQLVVSAAQDLSFGALMPGTPTVVPPTDPTRRAHFNLAGDGRFQIMLQLPALLIGPNGQTLPVTFGPTDGRLEIKNAISTFDPATGVEVRLNAGRPEADIFLGARANPAAGQRAGTYTATVVLMVIQTGN